MLCEASYSFFLFFPLLSLQADDVRALLTAAMPLSALPACYKPQVISLSASSGVATSDLSSGSGSTPQTATSVLESQDGHLPELLGPSGAEGAVGVEKSEEGQCVWFRSAEMCLAKTQFPKYPDLRIQLEMFQLASNSDFVISIISTVFFPIA